MAGTPRLGGIGRALSSRNFRLYWIGNVASLLGFWVQTLAMGWLVWSLTESELWLGLMAFATRMPAAILSPIAGAVADRFGLRRVASIALFVGATNSVFLFAYVFSGFDNVLWLLVFGFIQGLGVSFDLPSRQALIPNLLEDRTDLSAAIALNTTSFQAGAFVGPVVFAVLVQFADLSVAFLFYAVSFYFFAAVMLLLRLNDDGEAKRASLGVMRDIAEGLAYIRGHKGILAIILAMFAAHLLVRPYVDLLPAFADKVFNEGATGLATLQWASGGGSLVAGVILAARGRTNGLTRIMIVGMFGAYASFLLFAATNAFILGTLFMFLTGVALLTLAVASQSLVQNAVAHGVRGRVISITTGMAVGLPALGALILGSLAAEFGLQVTVVTTMLVALIYGVWCARAVYREGPRMEETVVTR